MAMGVALGGCTIGTLRQPAARIEAPSIDASTAAAKALAQDLEQLRHLAQAMPAQQAEIVATAQREFELAPTPAHQLRYAMMLSLPGHPAADPGKAQQLLRTLVARPESLPPPQFALAAIQLQQVDQRLAASTDTQRLQANVERSDREHSATLNKRLQSEVDENMRLRKELDEAQAKLDAIANIERSLSERRTTPEARKQ
jgi:hypothetical protein